MSSEKDKYSLWIVPKGKTGEALQDLIAKFAAEYNGPIFVPHMTIVANLMAAPNELQKLKGRIASLAKQLGGFSVSLSGYGYKDEEYRCLYLLAHSDHLSTVYETSAGVFPQVEDEHFKNMAHLSVLYGNIPESTKQDIIKANPFPDSDFEVSSLGLFQTNGDATMWQPVQEFPLGLSYN